MSSLRRDIARARSLSPRQRWLVAEAAVWLCLLKVATSVLPHRRVTSMLRLVASSAPDGALAAPADRRPGAAGDHPAATGWAVQAAAARTPWRSTCLVQSLAGYVILRSHGVPSAVYLGVAKNGAGEFVAHSWLCCGDRILTGGGHQRYSVIARYQPAAGPR